MKFTRNKRIALELFGPAAIGAGILGPINALANAVQNHLYGWKVVLDQTIQYLMFAVIAAYMWALLPSLLCACLLEWRFSRGLPPESDRQVGLSTLLGLLMGTGMAVVLVGFTALLDGLVVLAVFGGTGLAVGFFMGLLIKKLSAKEPATHNPTP